jgi:hypothetical protein
MGVDNVLHLHWTLFYFCDGFPIDPQFPTLKWWTHTSLFWNSGTGLKTFFICRLHHGNWYQCRCDFALIMVIGINCGCGFALSQDREDRGCREWTLHLESMKLRTTIEVKDQYWDQVELVLISQMVCNTEPWVTESVQTLHKSGNPACNTRVMIAPTTRCTWWQSLMGACCVSTHGLTWEWAIMDNSVIRSKCLFLLLGNTVHLVREDCRSFTKWDFVVMATTPASLEKTLEETVKISATLETGSLPSARNWIKREREKRML